MTRTPRAPHLDTLRAGAPHPCDAVRRIPRTYQTHPNVG